MLDADATDAEIDFWIERHRTAWSARPARRSIVRRGATASAAALYDLMLNRLPMYALIHRVRRQSFLPRVVRTWRRFTNAFRSCRSGEGAGPMNSPAWSFHRSNLLTYVSLAAGIGSVAAALQHSAAGAGAFLALAALPDTFDGRFARLFARSRELQALGAELDSLVGCRRVRRRAGCGDRDPAGTQCCRAVAAVWWLAAIGYAGAR